MLDLYQLQTFRMVANMLSFSRAAVALDYAQSTVTTHIQALEAQFGVPLFNRLGKHIELTEAGKRLLNYSEQLLDLAEETRLAVTEADSLTGTLTIGAPETICTYRLPTVLKAFRQAAPHVRLIFRPLPYEQLFQQVREGVIDIAFLLEQPVSVPNMETVLLCCEPLVLIASPEHGLVARECLYAADLMGESLLLTERGCGYRNLFEHELAKAGVPISTNLEFNSVEAIKQCLIANLGIGFLPRVVVERELAQGDLVVLPWQPSEVYTQLVWHKEKWLSPMMNLFLRLSQEHLRD